MKKDLIFVPIMLAIGVALFLLRFTGMPVHIVVSLVGVAVLIAYSVLTKKEWKLPTLEIVTRAFYGIALVTGVVIMNLQGIVALSVIHKICAALFVIGFAALFIHKLIVKRAA